MKNKHLVLLFVAALVIGWLTRDWPWRRALLFETELVRIDTSAITQMTLFVPANPELNFERTENGWAATQRNRSMAVSPKDMAPMLAALTDIQSISIVKTSRPDTLDLVDNQWIRLLIFEGAKVTERLRIGKETLLNGAPVTFIELEEHTGTYLVKGHLRQIFSKSLDDFRMRNVAVFDPLAVDAIKLAWPDSSFVHFEKNDSLGLWRMPEDSLQAIPDDMIQRWLALFERLNTCPFADHFDESRSRETRFVQVTLFQSEAELQLDFFHLLRPDVPEEWRKEERALGIRATYFVYSSQNPDNYFALSDSLLAQRISLGPFLADTLQAPVNQRILHENRGKRSR